MIVSLWPLPTHQTPFHYCVNQTMEPHKDVMLYKRENTKNGWRAWFLLTDGPSPTEDDKAWMRTYSTVSYHAVLLERLLTVRTEWSKK